MSWAIQLVIAAAIFLAGGATGIKVHMAFDAKNELEDIAARVEQERNDRKAVDYAAELNEIERSKIQIVYVNSKKEVARVIQTPFYAADQLCFDDAGLRTIEAAGSTAAPAPSLPASAVR